VRTGRVPAKKRKAAEKECEKKQKLLPGEAIDWDAAKKANRQGTSLPLEIRNTPVRGENDSEPPEPSEPRPLGPPIPPPRSTPERMRLGVERAARTRRFVIRDGTKEGTRVYATVGMYADGRIGELFITVDKSGSLARGAFDAFATAVSIGLQYGVPPDIFVAKMVGTRFEPSGFTGDPTFPTANSVLDLIGKWLQTMEKGKTT
jgi:ribonucleoside-diphosphate reductase alpha chain